MALEGSVHVPGFGTMDKKKALLIGGGLVLVVGIAYYRHKQSGGSTSVADQQTNPSDASNINPATGYPYGSDQDLAALAAQANAGLGTGGGIVDPNGTQNPNQTTSFVDNSAWERAAVDYLSGIGESATRVSAALGKYLAGQSVDDAERSIIDQAIAAENQPPIAGANGYPPHIRAAAPGPAPKELAAPHISIVHQDKKTATIHWLAVPHATRYTVERANGNVTQRLTGTRVTVNKPGTFTVVAHAPGWKDSPKSNALTFH